MGDGVGELAAHWSGSGLLNQKKKDKFIEGLRHRSRSSQSRAAGPGGRQGTGGPGPAHDCRAAQARGAARSGLATKKVIGILVTVAAHCAV